MLVLQMMLASAGNICFAAVVGFCWWCLDLLLMLVLGGCSYNIAVQQNQTKTVKAETSQKHISPKPFKMEALGPVLGIRNVKMKLWGTPWDPKSVKVGLWAPS